MQAEEASKGSVSNGETASDSIGDILTYERNCSYKASNYSGTSEAHLTSWQYVSNKGSCHH